MPAPGVLWENTPDKQKNQSYMRICSWQK